MARIGLLTSWLSRLGGGVFEAVVAQAELIRSIGHEPVVFGLSDRHSAEDRGRFGEAEVVTCPVAGSRAVGYSPALTGQLLGAGLDVLHLHGIWMYPSRAASLWASETGKPYLISPHGMMDPWITGRGKWKKAIARAAYERRSWRLATRFHALTESEADDVKEETGRQDHAIVIPNAVAPRPVLDRPADRYVLYLGRLHPKKNILALIEGWDLARDRLPGCRLLIAGWGEPDHVAVLTARLQERARDDIVLLGPVYGDRKVELLAQAHFLALPSLSEGLPVVVLEAWAAGTPSLMSRACHLPQGFRAGAAIDCGTDPATIAHGLRKGLGVPDRQWSDMSSAAIALVRSTFAPEVVGNAWAQAYAGLSSAPPGKVLP